MPGSASGPTSGPASGPASGQTGGEFSWFGSKSASAAENLDKPAQDATAASKPEQRSVQPPAEVTRSEVTGSEVTGSAPARSEAARSELARAEVAHSELARPEVAQPRLTPGDSEPTSRRLLLGLAVTLVLGAGALGFAVAGMGPDWIDGVGAILVAGVLSALVAIRTGGRAWIAIVLALALGAAAVLTDHDTLRTGAGVLTVVVGGVYAVLATVPARSFLVAVREVLIATLVAGVTAVAAVGFRPVVSVPRFDYVSMLLALMLIFVLVYRLGAGIHGLGRRGQLAVLIGLGALIATLAYADLLRRYGAASVVTDVLDFVDWTSDRIGAFPRPLVALLGIPALLWGCFQRARRRQGWWACAFGVTATVPLAQGLLTPDGSFVEASLKAAYSLIVGIAIGYVLVRLDLRFTAPRGRRGRRAEESSAMRPEPSRLRPL